MSRRVGEKMNRRYLLGQIPELCDIPSFTWIEDRERKSYAYSKCQVNAYDDFNLVHSIYIQDPSKKKKKKKNTSYNRGYRMQCNEVQPDNSMPGNEYKRPKGNPILVSITMTSYDMPPKTQ